MSDNKVKDKRKPDYWLLGTIVTLVLLGIIVLASVSAPIGFRKFNDTYRFLNHQLIFGLLPGLLLGYLAYKMDLALLKKWAPILLLFSLILMVLVFLPVIGSSETGSARWIGLGSFTFQPSELLKLTSVFYLAAWLVSRTKKEEGEKELGKTFGAFIVFAALIAAILWFQSDISTLGVILFVALIMYFTSNTLWWHSVVLMFMGFGGLFAFIKFAAYRTDRFLVFLNPDLDPMGRGYQIKQILIAIGSGGVVGVGLGLSTQKLGFVPQMLSDSIFAIFSEETGFIGSFLLIALFLIFLWRGFRVALDSKDKFLQLTALGITCWIVIQSFVNIGAMIGILPLTGIPLPFISYGGSALVVELIAMGVLLNISKKTR